MRQQVNTWFLLALAAVALYLCYLIGEPFLKPIFAAIVLAIVFYPLHGRILSLTSRPNLAATITTVLVIGIVAIPAVLLAFAVTKELGGLYQSLSEKSAAQGGLGSYVARLMEAPTRLLQPYIDMSKIDVRSTVLGWIDQISRSIIAAGAAAVSNIFSLVFATIVVFFTLFFLFRDGIRIQQGATTMLPLTREQARSLLSGISETIVASVHGGIAVGLAQGLLTGISFWVLGLSSPVLWGLVAAVASLIPLVGTGIVWVPGAIVLVLGGHWIKALVLVGSGSSSCQPDRRCIETLRGERAGKDA